MFPNYQNYLYDIGSYNALRNATVDNTSRSSSPAREVEAPPSRYSSSGWADSPPDDSPAHSYYTPYEDNSTASHGDRRWRGESSTQRKLLNEFGNLGLKQKNRRDNASTSRHSRVTVREPSPSRSPSPVHSLPPSRSPSPPPSVPIQDSLDHSTIGWQSNTPIPHHHDDWSGSSHMSWQSNIPISHHHNDWFGPSHIGWQSNTPIPYHHHGHIGLQSAYPERKADRYETVGARKIRLVEGWGESNGCVVTCIAMVANVSFAEARQAAIDYAEFVPGGERGLNYGQAQLILEKFGIKSYRYFYDEVIKWSSLPNLAFVTVPGSSGGKHAVVFVRSNNGEFIFDCQKDRPMSRDNYNISPNDAYLEIP